MSRKPLVSVTETETLLEWWNGDKKLSVYFEYDPPEVTYIAMVGSEFVEHFPSVVEAFTWLWE